MTFAETLTQSLQPIAELVRSLNLPDVIVRWGHPTMMGIVIFVMGAAVVNAGWTSRLSNDEETVAKSRDLHRKVAPLMTLFLTLGYTGGVLSLVTQNKPILESPHFLTGSIVVLMLISTGSFAFLRLKGEAKSARTAHAFVGSTAAILLVIHAALGLQLGLSL